jgi:hypothetical protein
MGKQKPLEGAIEFTPIEFTKVTKVPIEFIGVLNSF